MSKPTTQRPSIVLAVDLGGSGLRAGLFDGAGREVARARRPLPIDASNAPGREVDPASWWVALQACAEDLRGAAPGPFADIRAVAITAMTRTQVLVDADLKVLRPAMLWSDTRSETTLSRLVARLPASHPEARQVNGFHPLARLWWVAEREPEVARAMTTVLEPKDYLNARLTGIAASDPISSARMVAAAAAPAGTGSLLAAAGLAPGLVPAMKAPGSVVGPVAKGLPGALGELQGRPVVMTANDTWTAVTGLGALRTGYAYNLSGTSEVIGLLTNGPVDHPKADGLVTIAWDRGLTQVGGPSSAGGDTVAWMLGILGEEAPSGEATAARLDAILSGPGSGAPLLFLPHLMGERTPFWDPDLRGAWLGLAREHTRADLAQAVLEGVALLNRLVLERAEGATNERIAQVRFGGGGAANARWCQVKADVLGRTIAVAEPGEPGLTGAALVALAALGAVESLDQAQENLVAIACRYEPNPKLRDHYDRLFEVFRAAEAAIQPISHRLSRQVALKP